jgi:hypothetical protein
VIRQTLSRLASYPRSQETKSIQHIAIEENMKNKILRPKIIGPLVAILTILSIAMTFGVKYAETRGISDPEELLRFLPIPGGEVSEEAGALSRLEAIWNDRLTYPTGRFNPAWLRQAAAQDARIQRVVPSPRGQGKGPKGPSQTTANEASSQLTFSATGFTALGPQPLHMTGCSGCYDYGLTEGRINAIVVDPTTTTNGSIVAYAGSVGGGVWKTTNCCNGATTWDVVTDDPLISDISIDTLAIDPNDHNTIYAGTGDLNYGSFSMGSQGILKSADGGATWTVLGASVFGPAYSQPAGQFPQYDAVGKVRVDPNNSNNVVAGTKKGLFFSYDGGVNWTGPCLTNNFVAQRQDITGLELTDVGGGTRVIAAVGVRGFATTVQYDLGNNGANGLYSAMMPIAGCPAFTSIANNANGFVFGTSVSGSPYTSGANMNAGSGVAYVNSTTGDQLGRIDIAVAPSDPDVVYAQVQSIAPNNNSGCGNTNGCQLGVWVSINGGVSWTFMSGSAGGSLRNCSGSSSGDYPQNWYDQGMAVDPNDSGRVFVDTYEVWLATRTGSSFYDLTCGYNGSSAANHVVHVDQHALAFLPGSSSILLIGNDGGMHATTNADATSLSSRPTWFNLDGGLNTIEFYSGDISANFATSASPQANGGAQDNGSMSVTFSGYPTNPVQWQMGRGGDGFYARIDPVGTGTSLRFWQGNNSGSIGRCISNCTSSGATWTTKNGGWTSDTQSFILPYDLFHGGTPGGDDCPPAASNGGCGHLVVGTTRVWETVTGNAANSNGTVSWYVTNSPSTQNMTKQSLGNRSFINQVKYSPKYQSVAIVGTNDGNVWIGFNLGTGSAGQANWVNVTGNNVVLPNRPVLGIALDPSTSAANIPTGYAAVGGFNANTPSSSGHVFRVDCTANCASYTWTDKTGNLPDIPVDSIIVNPNFPQQVFAGTDWGLYFTDDITASNPVWYRFQNGLPNAMIWDMQIDRGATTLSVWTRSRGAYVWPLTSEAINKLDQTITFGALPDRTYGDADFSVSATASSGLPVTFSASGNCTVSGSNVHLTGAGSCTITASQAGNALYNPAPDLPQSFNIAKADQTISFPAIADKAYGDADFDPGASASSGLQVSYTATGSCSILASNVHITGVGSCQVTASQPGDDNYNAAADVSQAFNIVKGDQTISFPAISDRTFAAPPFDLNATASSGLPVSYSASGNCSVSGNTVTLTGIGSCTITASQPGDDNYNPAADVAQSFNIASAQTSLNLSVNPASVQYSDPITLQAVVSPASANGDTATGSVEFFVNAASVGSAAIDSSGKATLSLAVTYAPGNYNVTASFTSADANFTSSSAGPATLTVTKEDARNYYNGNSLFWTSSMNSTNVNAALSATIRDITAVDPSLSPPTPDNYAGDIRNAKVTFINRDTNTAFAGCSNLPIGLVNAGDTTTGTATCNTALTASSSTGATQYTVGIIVTGYYDRNSSEDDTIITVAQPIPSNFITGGGFLVLSNSSGAVSGDSGSKANFGFNVKYNKSGKNLQGNVNIIVRYNGHVYQIKSNAMDSLGVSGTQANFTGKASIQDITNPLNPVSVDGNATLQVWVTDNGDPGSSDTLAIQVLSKDGGTWFTSNWDGTRTVEQVLGGGNLSVH